MKDREIVRRFRGALLRGRSLAVSAFKAVRQEIGVREVMHLAGLSLLYVGLLRVWEPLAPIVVGAILVFQAMPQAGPLLTREMAEKLLTARREA